MHKLKAFSAHAYAALRFMSGWMFAFHGAQKMFGLFAPVEMPPLVFPSQMWLGGVIELVSGLMIAIGLRTREAAFLASGTMAVAYIQFHWKMQFNSAFFPAVNQGELAVLYCFLFLFFACQGAGRWSIDRE